MNRSLAFIRLFFIVLSVFFLTVYVTSTGVEGLTLFNAIIGISVGLVVGLVLIAGDYFLLKYCTLRVVNIVLFGLLFGYIMGQTLLLIADASFNLSRVSINVENLMFFKATLFLVCGYIGMVLIARAADEVQVSIPFIRFKSTSTSKKDILIDWTVFADARIIDIASSGLLDNNVIVPQFMLHELYVMLESSDESIRNKARRCLDVFKKLETITTLEMRYSSVDFPELKDSASKLIQLARILEANILTADVARLQQYAIEGIRIINIHMLSNVLKPMVTGELINIKIQRYGKEPRQGVGYLDDGTMVVVNGGAEYLGEAIKAQVLSVKHTTSGRMIFCNAAEEVLLSESALTHAVADFNSSHKNYFTV